PTSASNMGIENEIRSSLTCGTCKAGIYFLLSYAARSKPGENFRTFKDVCITFEVFPIAVCEGLISRLSPQLNFILYRANFDVNEYCAMSLNDENCMGNGRSVNENWEVEIPSIPKPTSKNIPLPKENVPNFKVLHLTDTHYDPFYVEGANAVCKEPLCCRDNSQIVSKESDRAGKWGDYRDCDPPKAAIENLFDHIVEVHPDIDYIIWTGDLQPHNVWSETKEENVKLLREMVAIMKAKFPNIPIFPAIGNHEGSPVNSFPQTFINDPQFSGNWLYDEIDHLWRIWLPENVSPTIKYGGFYSVLVRPAFRIISINTNYCYFLNLWLLINATDPISHLQWLAYELQAAELSNEKVHIIGHIPPGNVDCMRIWSRNYFKIIERFQATVTGQFFGHTHGDEIEVFLDPKNLSRAINVAYIAPSITPFTNFNPGYKIYYVDGDHPESTRMVIDKDCWTYNLSEANIKGTPEWYKLYSARSIYNMDGLRPDDWNELINRMEDNDDLVELYHKVEGVLIKTFYAFIDNEKWESNETLYFELSWNKILQTSLIDVLHTCLKYNFRIVRNQWV
ncbi:Sphingomyelin phosphodiesterase, partial [Pseudolycoriella hygida]